jgi:hypothetical protein
MATCVSCGRELHPERAEKYDYCTEPQCVEQNARGLDVVAVGVNKAAEQFVVLDDRTRREMQSGRYKKQPDVPRSIPASRSRVRGGARPAPPRPPERPPHPARSPRREWSEAQENLVLIYREMGLTPKQIASKLSITERLATKILLGATAARR